MPPSRFWPAISDACRWLGRAPPTACAALAQNAHRRWPPTRSDESCLSMIWPALASGRPANFPPKRMGMHEGNSATDSRADDHISH
eukprot:1135979-Pyramimonas_sp.AAC.1